MEIQLDQGTLARMGAAVEAAVLAAAEALRTDVVSAQVMPFDNGDLQNNQTSAHLEERGERTVARLETDAPQARRLYFHPEYKFQTVNNPNARGEWLEPWLPGGEKEGFAQKAFEQELGARL